jgi:hypothetical protein
MKTTITHKEIGNEIELTGNHPAVTEWQNRHCASKVVQQRPFNAFDEFGMPSEFDEYLDAEDHIQASYRTKSVKRASKDNADARKEANAISFLDTGASASIRGKAIDYLKKQGYKLE